MSIIDERGRVFGRLNVIDAALALLLVLMVPVAYGAYLLFRDPAPQLTAIRPPVLVSGPNAQLEIRGENLRPYMRVSFDTIQAPTFLFGSPTLAVVNVPDLAPGKYDVVLYDYSQEVARLKDALTIAAEKYPRITVHVTGAFIGVTDQQIAMLTKGYQLPEVEKTTATILDADGPRAAVARVHAGTTTLPIPVTGIQELPANVSIECDLRVGSDGLQHCFVGSLALSPDVVVTFGGPKNALMFRVSEVHYPGQSNVARVRVRFTPKVNLRNQIRPGDRDIAAKAYPAGKMATIDSVEPGGERGTITAVLSLEAQETATGWMYKGGRVKVGAPIGFETLQYVIEGIITDVRFQDEPR